MVNRAMVITLSLLMQLSFNTATANISQGVEFVELEAPYSIEQQENTYVHNSDDSSVDTNFENLENKHHTEVAVNKREIDKTKPMIALTYDDGPSKYTEDILNILKENNSSATFFVLGMQVNKYENTILRMVEEGNQIGNHTYDHKRLTLLDDEELYYQINNTDNLIYEATLYKPFLMRPPYGTTSEDVVKKVEKPIIKWSIDTRDWESRNVDKIVEIILNDVKDGDIILMHDLYESTLQASKIVIPELIKRGYQLVTVSELSEHKDIILQSGKSYYHMH